MPLVDAVTVSVTCHETETTWTAKAETICQAVARILVDIDPPDFAIAVMLMEGVCEAAKNLDDHDIGEAHVGDMGDDGSTIKIWYEHAVTS
jgi:hypothetical protein